MTKKTVFLVTLLFAFTLALTLAITVSADVDCYSQCCDYHFTVNGVDCWTGGNLDDVTGICVLAEPKITCLINGNIKIVDNPCYTEHVNCESPIPVEN